MAEAVIDVERNLRVDLLTAPEVRALLELREKTVRDLVIAATGGAVVTFFGASISCGYWSINKSLDRHIDRLLSMDGTWLQKELSASLLRRYHNNPRIMNRFSKHFYAEKVYDDSSDIPKFRWRPRYVYEDDAGNSEDATDTRDSASYKSAQKRVVTKEAKSVSKPAQINTAVELIENPFECIFGPPVGIEQVLSSGASNISRSGPGPSNTARKRHTHSNKRHHHRRHRKNHFEAYET
ncbi:OLC1v1020022C2 [Oldenlandia corymbosa var. corymbosa]|uniref:OLC1v1020022C2 n=1 Tax=Oldenlandia corymbosa var. corymbosa TaxID=529605 RepID=A0AAV1EFB8_OLDCO|nr:OLC1v1020022C2 [Oldenlandia corymbosa var. corymbosa]